MAVAPSTLQTLSPDTRITGAKPWASLAIEAAEISRRVPLEWGEDIDELGPHRHIAVRARDGGPPFVLVSYAEAPTPNTVVLAGETIAPSDLDHLLMQLHVRSGEVIDRIDTQRPPTGARTDMEQAGRQAGHPAGEPFLRQLQRVFERVVERARGHSRTGV
jgi:hypothetical protein